VKGKLLCQSNLLFLFSITGAEFCPSFYRQMIHINQNAIVLKPTPIGPDGKHQTGQENPHGLFSQRWPLGLSFLYRFIPF
jgi:hypothetical protein